MNTTLLRRAAGYAGLARHARNARSADETVRVNARLHLAARMGKLRGLPQKIGQMLSMSDASDEADAFAPLGDRAEPLPFRTIEPILREAWGRPVHDVVRSIDEHGLAASLGQVHRAELRDGRPVAVKVRYPRIRQAVLSDLKMLGWLSAPVGDLRRGFDLAGYRREILRDLEDELDYRIEAGHQRRFRAIAADMPDWIVPPVVDELCRDNVLVTGWIDGDPIDAVEQWPATDREQLASRMIRGFFSMLFHTGLIHADPHPGNYRFTRASRGPRIVLYDFGSVASMTREHRVALLKLIQVAIRKNGDPYKPLLALGFNEALLAPIRSKLAALCNTLFEPFRCPGKYDLSRWRRTERIDDILGDDRWNFRLSGPPHLIFVLRAFRGLTYYLRRLDAPVAWSIALKPYLAEFRDELEAFDADPDPREPGSFRDFATHLKIRVTDSGQQKIALTFLATTVDDLGGLIDEDLQRRIDQQGIDIDAIVRRVRRTAYVPQELFFLAESESGRGVRVWLE